MKISLLICCPSYNSSETLSTLRFGHRAKNIQNKAVINEERSAEEYRVLLAKAEKAIQKQKAHIVVLESKITGGHEDELEEIRRPDPTLEVVHCSFALVFQLSFFLGTPR